MLRSIPDKCVKQWGPVTESRHTVLKSITIYDESIEPEEVYLLDALYSNVLSPLCGRTNFTQLSRIFAGVYGQSLRHDGGLRHAVIAIVAPDQPWSSRASASTLTLEHLEVAYRAQISRLDHPDSVDEGDLFVAYLLAMGAVGRLGNFEAHANGVISIMKHLCQRRLDDYLLSPFWYLIRDDILWVADYFPEKGLVDNLADKFRQHIGHKKIDQRQNYVAELERARIPNDPELNVTYTSPETLLMRCLRLVQRRQFDKDFERNAYAESILVDCRGDTSLTHQKRRESLLTMNLQAQPQVLETVESRTLVYYFELVSHHLIRLCVAVVEADSTTHGLRSLEGINAAISLVSLFKGVHEHVLSRKQTARDQFWCNQP